ncbi:uncharacterized protein EI97DRAFT_494599 [Westerdykella ornata]|uniref:RanBD1 domain-containing protein n=1 Tax=Westerdykella ornata TaxID=318751 RepID=A0A6A6JHK7_WESOR|nr:uncharacterized protein EI97DRAFT_494599 [Westerdykella ornata]KAF2275684.1 hypothetical protein EI97DRAFT_494599 [Westerdykella ornata]
MAGSLERPVSPKPAPAQAATGFNIPASPTGSARSSDSEGKPVRKKLKETRIDAQGSAERPPSSDRPMHDVTNGTGTATAGDNISSESESGRGRLRRKRSREDFEEDDKDKPVEKKKERHVRKKSRDVTSPAPAILEGAEMSAKSAVDPIKEHDADETMAAESKTLQNSSPEARATPEAGASDKDATRTSPKNKRTHDQTKTEENDSELGNAEKGARAADTAPEEPSAKRPREKSEVQTAEVADEGKTKIPPGSGFANVSAASPFASLSPKKPSAGEKAPQDLPQTSDEKFKSSGFRSFAASSASPFGAIAASAKSPFGAAAGGSKLTSFASPSATSVPAASGFGSLAGSATKSGFGGATSGATAGSVFGGALGQSGFSGLGASKGGLSSFASPGAGTIVGLSKKPNRPFGAAADDDEEGSGDEDEGSSDGEASDKEEAEKSKQGEQEKRSFVAHEALETGEEGEDTIWSARAKLYIFRGKDGWQERGAGVVKLNVAQEGPRNPRFILRADGTHRLLLNARVRADLKFGTTEGTQPEDGKLFFAAPTTDGQVLTHLLKMKPENAKALWKEVLGVKADL